MHVINAMVVFVLLCTYARYFYIDSRDYGPTFRSGISFGIIHLILLPLAWCSVSGELRIDPQFLSETTLENLDWQKNSDQIGIMLLPVFSLMLCLPFLKQKVAISTDGQPRIKFWTYSYVIFALTGFILVGFSDGGGHWYRAREDFSRENGQAAVLSVFVQTAIQLIAVSSLFKFMENKNFPKFTTFINLFLIIFIDLYTSGNRIWVVYAASCFIVNLINFRKYATVFVMAILMIPLGFTMTIFRWFRAYMHYLSDGSIGGLFSSFEKAYYFTLQQIYAEGFGLDSFISGITESVNLSVYQGVVKVFGEGRPLLYGESILKGVIFWIPRSWWEAKPEGITTVAAKTFAPGVDYLSLVTTIFGENFANFGIMSAVISPIMILFLNKYSHFISVRSNLNSWAIFIFGMAIIRFPIADFCLVFFIAAVVHFVAGSVLWHRRS